VTAVPIKRFIRRAHRNLLRREARASLVDMNKQGRGCRWPASWSARATPRQREQLDVTGPATAVLPG
jgi:hypothetical protein